MPLTLYYLAPSPPVRSVDLLIHTLGLEVEHKEVNFHEGEHLSPQYLKVNPLHTVPAITDVDGFTLWESRAIMTYLVSKYGKDDALYPKDLKKRAIVDQRLHFSNDAFFALKDVTKPLYLYKKKPEPEKIEKVREMQENVEKLLAGSKFFAGDNLTVADYAFITIMDILEEITSTHNKYPLTASWFSHCKSTMKDFDQVNAKGANILITILKENLR